MIGVTKPPFTCVRCGHVEMTLTAISRHDRACAAAEMRSSESRQTAGVLCSWFEFRVRIYMWLFMLDLIRQGRRKG